MHGRITDAKSADGPRGNKILKTSSKTIMNYVSNHTKRNKRNVKEMVLINYARLCKQITFSCKLVGLTGRKKTKGCKNQLERSCLK